MNDPHLNEKKKILTLRVKNNIINEEWKSLTAAFPVAEEMRISNGLLKKAAKKIGEYFLLQNNHFEAVIFFNKARVRDLSDGKLFKAFVESTLIFFNKNVKDFSKNDLEKFKLTILPIINFHNLNYPEHREIIKPTELLFRRIDYRIKYVAQDVQETKVTHRVQQIKNALYADMSPQEIRDEFAKLIEDDLRELLEEKKSAKTKKKKSKKSGKKPLK